MVINWQRQTL